MAAFGRGCGVHAVFSYLLIATLSKCSASQTSEYNLHPNAVHRVRGTPVEELAVFCHRGRSQPLLTRCIGSFTSNKVYITSEMGDRFEFQLYVGNNETHVRAKYEESQSLFWPWIIPWQTNTVSVPQFNKTCVAVYTKHPYNIKLEVKVIDAFLVAYFIAGLLLFISAKPLSRNIVFYYGTGVSVGVLASLLILVFVLSRFIPYKKGAIMLSFIGSSIVAFFAHHVWENLHWILEVYSHYVVGYFVTAGVLSFLYCYWRGPVTNQRSQDIIKWTIQLAALLLVYNSIQVWEMAVVVIITLIIFYNVSLPHITFRWVFRQWHKRFPRARRLINEDEFRRQGEEETQKSDFQALDELREYCRSPKCDAWRVISRMNSPQRFAQFVEGTSHLTDDEMSLYEDDIYPNLPEISDDEDEMDFRLSSQ